MKNLKFILSEANQDRIHTRLSAVSGYVWLLWIAVIIALLFQGHCWRQRYEHLKNSFRQDTLKSFIQQQKWEIELSRRLNDTLKIKLLQSKTDKLKLETQLQKRKIIIQTRFIQDSTLLGELETSTDTIDFLIIDRDRFREFYFIADSTNKVLFSENDSLITWALQCTSELDSCNAGRTSLVNSIELLNGNCSKIMKKQKRKAFWANVRNDVISFGLGYLTGKVK